MKIKEKILVVLLILYFIDPFNYGFVFGYLTFLFLFGGGKVIFKYVDKSGILLLVFSVIYGLFYAFNPFSGTQFIFIYTLLPITFYLVGKVIANNLKTPNQRYFFFVGISTVFSLVALISVLINIAEGGFVQSKRDVPLLWGETPNATGTAAYLFANMCIPALFIFSAKKKYFKINLLLIILFVLSFVSVLRLGSRTQIGIALIVLISSIIYKSSKLSPIKNILLFGSFFLIINVLIGYISIDKDSDLLASYATRMDSKTNGASSAGGRTELWEKSIANLFQEPLGWDLYDFGYSHNMWLNAARVGTIFAFLSLLLFTIVSIKNTLKFLNAKHISSEIKNLVLCLFIAFHLQFLVEPILDGSFHLFAYFCLFQGIVNFWFKKLPN